MINRKSPSASTFRLGISVLAAAILGLACNAILLSTANAQGADVQITELDCNGDPELVVITNAGDTEIAMTGWNLQSDPTASESLALSQFGFLSPDETLMIESGPSAEGAFVWSQEFLFRDNDATDFAQLASDAGDVLLKVNCSGPQQQTATPAAASPAPTALAVSDAPAGGGAPGPAAELPPALLIALGSGVFTAGLGTLALPVVGRLRRRSPRVEAEPAQEPPEAPAPERTFEAPPSQEFGLLGKGGREKRAASKDSLRPYLFLAVIVLALITVLVFLLQTEDKKRE